MRPYASVVLLLLAWVAYTVLMAVAVGLGVDVRNPFELIGDILRGIA